MARADKAAAVAELTERFRESNAAVLTEYRGLSVAQLTQLRSSIKGDGTYAVVKNTLTKIAAERAGVPTVTDTFAGPTAVAFVHGDPVEVAKGLRDFARTHPALVIKGGLLDGRPLSADEVRQLADLESREVLLAKLAGAIKASLTKAAYLFVAPLSQAVRTVDALRAKREEEAGPSAAEPGAAEPTVAEPTAAEPTAADNPIDAASSGAEPGVAIAEPSDTPV